MTLWPIAEAIATAVILSTDRQRYEIDAAIAGMHLPRVPHPDEPLDIGWSARMVCSYPVLIDEALAS